ncbi:MAG TPA: glycosyltransferase family 39 protein [Pirellulales bacterium]|nr:glycosyltransferase family 39 protein [Pirellulales bacterium]
MASSAVSVSSALASSAPAIATPRRPTIGLACVLLVALVIRGGLFFAAWHAAPDFHSLLTGDSPTYIGPAKTLLSEGSFLAGAVPEGAVPEIYRTPGYPLLLTAGLAAGHLELVTVAIQTLLSLASILLVYRLAHRLTGSASAALAASGLAAVEPLSIIYTSLVMPETLFTFLFLASTALLLRYLDRDSLPALFGSALLLAAATFVRPITYYLPPLLLCVLAARAILGRGGAGQGSANNGDASLASSRSSRSGRLGGCIAAVGFGLVAFAPCAAWQVRNYVETGYSGFTGIPECNLYFSQAASVLARLDGKSIQDVQAELGQYDDQMLAALHGPEQAATIRRLGAEGRKILAEHPLDYAKIHLRCMLIWLLDPGGSDLLCLLDRHPVAGGGLRPLNSGVTEMFARLQRDNPELLYATLALATGLGLAYCCAALGLLAVLRHFTWHWICLFVPAAYFWLLGGTLGCARLRQPVMPLVCLLAGWGLAITMAWFRRRRTSAAPAARSIPPRRSPAVQQAA